MTEPYWEPLAAAPAAPVAPGAVVLFDSVLAAAAAQFDTGAGGFATTFAKLVVEWYGRSDVAPAENVLGFQFNNDAAANYDYISGLLFGSTTVSATSSPGVTYFGMPSICPGAAAPAGHAGVAVLEIPNYAGTVFHKAGIGHGYVRRGGGSTDLLTALLGFSWRSTAAVNRIRVFPSSGNFIAGTRLRVVGHP